MKARRFRKKPVVIEAMQFSTEHRFGGPALHEFLEGCVWIPSVNGRIIISTLEGDMSVAPGDWVIKGVAGEFYPCKPEIFAATYEPVDGGGR